jgi:hypothetical protein
MIGAMRRLLSSLLTLTALAWSGWFLSIALDRWRFEAMCVMACGPFWEAETVDLIRRSMDWQTPLGAAIVPLALLTLPRLFRLSKDRFRRS